MTSIYPSNLTILDGKDFCLYTPSTQTGNSEIQLCILCKDAGSIVHWKLSPAGGGLLITFNSEDLNITPGFLLECLTMFLTNTYQWYSFIMDRCK